MNLVQAKSLFNKILIACLIGAGLVAVVTVLIGSFNSVCAKALGTIAMVALHSILSISFIANNEKQKTFETLEFFTNVTFGLIVLSFITSIFGVWGILGLTLLGKLYALYFVLLFAVLHGEVLAKTLGKQQSIDNVVRTNFFFMAAVVLMLMPVIFSSSADLLGGFYYRLLAALGIIDATLTLIAIILHNMYVQKHPKLPDPVFAVQYLPGGGQAVVTQPTTPPKRHMNGFVVLLLVYVGLQVAASIFIAILGSIKG